MTFGGLESHGQEQEWKEERGETIAAEASLPGLAELPRKTLSEPGSGLMGPLTLSYIHRTLGLPECCVQGGVASLK